MAVTIDRCGRSRSAVFCWHSAPPAHAARAAERSAAGRRRCDAAHAQRRPTPNPSIDLAYVCPMDRDIRSSGPGKCPRCGMELVAGVPDQTEYHLDLAVTPRPAKPNETVHLTFAVFDPWKDRPVEKFSVVHEKLFHAFIVSRDLQFFVHDHPVWRQRRVPLRHRASQTWHVPGARRLLPGSRRARSWSSDTIFVAGDEAPRRRAGARLLDEGRREPEGRVLHEPGRTRRRRHDADARPPGAGRGPAEISGRLGPHACRQRRPDRHDPHASLHRRRQPADAIQPRVPAAARLSRLGAVPAQRRRQHGAFRCACQAPPSERRQRPLHLATSRSPTTSGCPRRSRTGTAS